MSEKILGGIPAEIPGDIFERNLGRISESKLEEITAAKLQENFLKK